MKIFKRIFVMFLLIFSSQQILANNTNFNKKNDVFIQQIEEEYVKDVVALIMEYEEITGLRYQNLLNPIYFLKLVQEEAYSKLELRLEKLPYAIFGLEGHKEIKKIIENIDKNKYRDDEYIADVDKVIKKIKPRNMEEIKHINEIKNFINFYKKFLKIKKLESKIEENVKILNANGVL